MSSLDLTGWVPIRMDWRDTVEWCYFGSARFTDPFFDTTVHLALREPFHELFRRYTRFSALRDWHERSPGLKPTGFIFHLSRCGSTLVTQMLTALPSTVVISEAPPIDSIVRSERRAPQVPMEQRIEWLQWMVSAFGQRRTGAEQHFFIKFEPQSTRQLPFIRAAFPDVPWIFVYRDPVEVMVSNLRRPSAGNAPGQLGLDILDIPSKQIADMPYDEYVARVTGTVCEAACRFHDPLALPVNYVELPGSVTSGIARHFGLAFGAEEISTMQRTSLFDAKNPKQRFQADSGDKHREATGRVRELAERWIGPHYRKLEKLRRDA